MGEDEIKILEKYQLWSAATKLYRGAYEENNSYTNCSQDSCNCSGCNGCYSGCSSCSG